MSAAEFRAQSAISVFVLINNIGSSWAVSVTSRIELAPSVLLLDGRLPLPAELGLGPELGVDVRLGSSVLLPGGRRSVELESLLLGARLQPARCSTICLRREIMSCCVKSSVPRSAILSMPAVMNIPLSGPFVCRGAVTIRCTLTPAMT